jgi:hypothetical protein
MNNFTDYQQIANDLYLQNIQLRTKVQELEEKFSKIYEMTLMNTKNAEINARNAEHNVLLSKILIKGQMPF